MTFRAFTIMKIVVVVSFAICALVFLLLPDDSQAGKTKKGPLVTEKVGKLLSGGIQLMRGWGDEINNRWQSIPIDEEDLCDLLLDLILITLRAEALRSSLGRFRSSDLP